MTRSSRGSRTCILLLTVVCAFAQSDGRITARILEADGQPAAGVEIELVLPAGDQALTRVKSGPDGFVTFAAVPPGLYDLRTGSKILQRDVLVSTARETDLGAVTLGKNSSQSEPAYIPKNVAEVATTFVREQVARLPVLARDPTRLVGTMAGSGQNVLSPTSLNGLRPAYTVTTLDGVNVLDQFSRIGVDGIADTPRLDQVAEMTVIASNASAANGFGVSQVALITPSGTNQYHGSLYGQNRNSFFGANNWFSNRDGLERPRLNYNAFGGAVGGPAWKDKVLFYGNYEGSITRLQGRVNRTLMTEDARRGIYTYSDPSGTVRKVNVLQAAGVQPDPALLELLQQVPGADKINNFQRGDSRADFLRNYAGYSYNMSVGSETTRLSSKLDWRPAPRHFLFGSMYLQRISSDQPSLSTDFSTTPKVAGIINAELFSLGWQWQASPTWTVETRLGRNGYAAIINTSEQFGPVLLNLPTITNPVNNQVPVGRDGTSWNVGTTATRAAGTHLLQFGYQWQRSRNNPFDELGSRKTCTIGIGTGNPGLTLAAFPGLPSNELSAANSLLALHAGYVSSCGQTFNVKDRTSGFVPGQANRSTFLWSIHGFFVQDQWRIHSRFTVSLGLRYEVSTVVDRTDGLLFIPVDSANNVVSTLRSNLLLDFSGPGTGRTPYQPDRNNFAPRIGLAFRADRPGNMILRAGYGVNHVEDIATPLNISTGLVNEGLRRTVNLTNTSARVGTNLPVIAAPVFKTPLTLAETFALNPAQGVVLPDPNLRTPYVQQWTAGVERRFPWAVVEVRYSGNHAVGIIRGIDQNQVILRENGFLDDFLRAAENGRLAQAATGIFNPAFNAAITGSQPLTVFPRLAPGQTNSLNTVLGLITGQPAALASNLQTSRLNGSVNFFPNPFALQTWLLSNHDHSTYNSFQIESRTRGRGHFLSVNYTFSKVLSNSLGIGGSRLEPFLDIYNTSLDRARPAFDQRHAFKAAGVWDLPLGPGHSLNLAGFDRVLGGWSFSAILIAQSGAPLSILSGKATLSLANSLSSADALVSPSALQSIVGFRQTANGPYFIDPAVIAPDGRGVASDGQPKFSGQAFAHPRPDSLGTLQRRVFTGPASVLPVLALSKITRITERQTIEFRAEALNFLNHPSFLVADQSIGSTNFGKISAASDARILQFNLYYRF